MRKHIFFFLLFLPLLSLGQTVKVNNNTVSIDANGRMTISSIVTDTLVGDLVVSGFLKADTVKFEPPHCYMSFDDSAQAITGGTNIQITNSYDSLFSVFDENGITWITGDTFKIVYKGGFDLDASVYGSGNNGADWRIRIAYKRGATVYYTNRSSYFTTIGTANRQGDELHAYLHLQKDDKVWLVLSRIGGTGDFTAIIGSLEIQTYYRE